MGQNLTRKLLEAHLVSGKTVAGEEIGLRVDQALLTDTNGTMAFLQFEAMGFPRVRPSRVVAYIDHNVYQVDSRNSDDHRYLQTASSRYGAWFSKPGNGICHQVHFESFSVPGQFVLGTDSHTPLCGSTGMLAIGAGGLDVAVAMGGGPYHVVMPRVTSVWLTGRLRPWVSAKDVIMELLRRYTVRGGSGRIFEYGGPGAATLSAAPAGHHLQHGRRADPDHQRVPLGRRDAGVLPSARARGRLAAARSGRRRGVRRPDRARSLEPRAAGRACPGRRTAWSRWARSRGTPIEQVMVGSCTNSSWEDMQAVTRVLEGRKVAPSVSFVVFPGEPPHPRGDGARRAARRPCSRRGPRSPSPPAAPARASATCRPRAGAACARSTATSRAGAARRTTRSTCAHR